MAIEVYNSAKIKSLNAELIFYLREMNRNRDRSIVYFLLGVYTAMVSWFYYHSILLLILHWIFWPLALIYFILTGHLAHGAWLDIPKHFFS